MLPHFTNVTPTATDLHEPLYSNLFEVTFTFPSILNLNNNLDQRIMMMNALNINLDLTKDLEKVAQKFKFSERAYLKTPNTTLAEFDIEFNINVDNNFSMRTWNYLKKWYDLAWNSQTGELHYKRDMVGSIVAHIHDRAGVVVRRVEFRNVLLHGLKNMQFSWETNDIIKGQAKFIADYWIDQYYNIGQ